MVFSLASVPWPPLVSYQTTRPLSPLYVLCGNCELGKRAASPDADASPPPELSLLPHPTTTSAVSTATAAGAQRGLNLESTSVSSFFHYRGGEAQCGCAPR